MADLFDLTRQPNGIITTDNRQPLFSVEGHNKYQYRGGNTKHIVKNISKGFESLRYSTSYTQTIPNHRYEIIFDVMITEEVNSNSKLELQFYNGGIYPNDANTFFTIEENDFTEQARYKTVKVEYDAALRS
mgnify:FL=1